MKKLFLLILITFSFISAQEGNKTSSFFDDTQEKVFNINSIFVEGEVENPGETDLTKLPLTSVVFKEAAYDKQAKFVGSYHCTGYSLFDIVNSKILKKANYSDFPPNVDLYIIIENAAGKKVVVSWGELFYSKNFNKIVLTKQVTAINPSKMKMQWPVGENARFIFPNDLFNGRYIDNPTKITVKSNSGNYPKNEKMYSETFDISLDGKVLTTVKQVDANSVLHKFDYVGYGHGRGFKGINEAAGYALKDIVRPLIQQQNTGCYDKLVVISSKDSYRATYSLSEIINRNDCDDFLVTIPEKDPEDGKYNVFATPDFFVDRNVRSVDKIEIITIR